MQCNYMNPELLTNNSGMQYHEMASEAFYLMALIYNSLGKPGEREEASASFRKHILALENPQDDEDQLVHSL